MNRLPVIVGSIFAVVYAIVGIFFAWFWFSGASFGAVFFLGLIGVPSSFIANAISKLFSESANLNVEVILMVCLGVAQYFGVGYFLGWLFSSLRHRAS